MQFIGALGLAAATLLSLPAWATPTVISFDETGLATAGGAPVGNFYSGGGGPNKGVSFSGGGLALARSSGDDGYDGTPGVLWLEALDTTGNYVGQGTAVIATINAAFGGSFAFSYEATDSFTVDVFDSSGVLATNTFSNVNTWTTASLSGFGAATKVVITGRANGGFLDNFTFGDSGSGGTVPEPGSLALVGLALAGLGAARFRKSA